MPFSSRSFLSILCIDKVCLANDLERMPGEWERLPRLGRWAKCLGADVQRLNFSQGAMPHDLVVLTMERIGKRGLSALRAHTVLHVPIAC